MEEPPPHVQRMIAEGNELAGRVARLGEFLSGPTFGTLGDMQQVLLSAQLGAMTTYLQILNLRISLSRAAG